MSDIAASDLVQTIAGLSGLDGCALLDAETGMAWHHAGHLDGIERLGEAAVEMWRAEARLRDHFGELGSMQSAAFSFEHQVVAIFPCCASPALVLVCVGKRGLVTWPEVAPHVAQLKAALAKEFGQSG